MRFINIFQIIVQVLQTIVDILARDDANENKV